MVHLFISPPHRHNSCLPIGILCNGLLGKYFNMSWLIFVIQTKWIVCACVKMSTLSFMFWRQIISMEEQQGVFTTHIKPIWNGLTITSMFNRCSISFYPQSLRKILKLLIQWLILCVAEGRFEFVMWFVIFAILWFYIQMEWNTQTFAHCLSFLWEKEHEYSSLQTLQPCCVNATTSNL